MTATLHRGNVLRLAAAQALSMTTMNVNIINTALVGSLLAPVAWLATLPLSLTFITSMMTTLPASLLMTRFGRRPVFLTGVLISSLGAFLFGIGIILGSFLMLCFGSMFFGVAIGCAGYYRYAAADSASEEMKPKAISYVLAGGLMAALFGPEIARNTVDLIPNFLYAGCFFTVSAVQLVSLFFISGIKIERPDRKAKSGRPLGYFLKQPVFVVGMISAAIGYALMSYLMTATPLQVVNVAALGTSANATIIQWHVVAMFAPSFVTGSLIGRFGVARVLGAGLLAYVATIYISVTADAFWSYWTALFLLGLGWNFLYIGGSSLIAKVALPQERGRVQGFADLITTSTVAAASLTAGILHSQMGWVAMSLAAVPPVCLVAVALVWLVIDSRRVVA
ncbi:MFS transporter [Alphaproteobacteria bacterium]|nr:MFS transporter [Alphaproteobacteria bacterium]